MQITLEQVKQGLKYNEELDEYTFEINGDFGDIVIDIDGYDSSLIAVYCCDHVLYTFSKQYSNLNHAVNAINKFFNN